MDSGIIDGALRGANPPARVRDLMRRFPPGLLLATLVALAAGCSRSAPPEARGPAPPPAPPDTLIGQLAPFLADWLAVWRSAAPATTLDSLQRESEVPFTLHDIHRYDVNRWEEARRRRLFAVYAPDSTRFIDPDTRFDATREERTIELTRGLESSPALVDLKTRSTSGLETSWQAGDCDGAFWLGNERFAITGTSPGADTTGARYGFVRVFDLNAGTVIEYQTPRVGPQAFKLFQAARDSARTLKYRRIL